MLCLSVSSLFANSPPTIDGDCFYIDRVAAGNEGFALFFGNDPDPNDVLMWDAAPTQAVAGAWGMDPLSGVLTYTPDISDTSLTQPIEFIITLTDSSGEMDQCLYFFEVIDRGPVDVFIERVSGKPSDWPSGHILVDVYIGEFAEQTIDALWGYGLAIGYDTLGLELSDVTPGEMLQYCEWEAFTWEEVTNCYGNCPGGLVRIEAVAELDNGANHPVCFKPESGSGSELVTLDFLITDPGALIDSLLPLQFFWEDCGTNSFPYHAFNAWPNTDAYGNGVSVYSYGFDQASANDYVSITDIGSSLPNFRGMPDSCFVVMPPGDSILYRLVDYFSVLPGDWWTRPWAFIDSVTPEFANVGQTVFFGGHSQSDSSTIIAYEWRSSIDGVLSSDSTFSSSGLSEGFHKIYLAVQGDDLNWSSYCTARLIVGVPANSPTVSSTSPSRNALNVPTGSSLQVVFDRNMDESTIDSTSFLVHGDVTGMHWGTYSYNGPSRTVTFDPYDDFLAGEVVTVTLTRAIESTGGLPLDQSYTYRFTCAVTGGYGYLVADQAYAVGQNPQGIAIVDVDNDLAPDLVVTNYLDYNASIRLNVNDGSGHFEAETTHPLSTRPLGITGADLDRDGDMDLASANYWGNNVSVLTNDGGGLTFFDTVYAAEQHAVTIDNGDLDGDGDIDLVVNHDEGDQVLLFYNNGDATYAEPYTAFGTPNNPWAVITADVDDDGFLDVINAGNQSDSVSVHINDGSGGLLPYAAYGVEPGPRSIAAADFDADGDLDLAAASWETDSLTVLTNDGGTFTLDTVYAIGNQCWAVVAGDFDGDGWLDLVATSRQAPTAIHYLQNLGNGKFRPAIQYDIPDGANPFGAAAADFDGDGDLDLAVTFEGTDSVLVMLNQQPPDSDGDGIGDPFDNCAGLYNPLQEDWDGDWVGDSCDNCMFVANADQADSIPGGAGDACEASCGNVNNDPGSMVSLTDLVLLRDYVVRDEPSPISEWAADVDVCPGISVSDIERIYDFLFGFPGGGAPCTKAVDCNACTGASCGAVSIDEVPGQIAEDSLLADSPITFRFRIANNSGQQIDGFTHGFRLYSPDGATWSPASYDTASIGWPDRFSYPDPADHFNEYSFDGAGEDTLSFGYAFPYPANGLEAGFDSVVFTVTTQFSAADVGKTFCIDTCFFGRAGVWEWSIASTTDSAGIGRPAWAGPYCYTIVASSDVDGDGIDDALDNCPTVYNPTQDDTDGDGIGDACEASFTQTQVDSSDVLTVATADLDSDNFGDVVWVAQTDPGLYVAWGQSGTPPLSAAQKLLDIAKADIEVFHINTDTIPDIVAATGDWLYILLNNGDRTFTVDSTQNTTSLFQYRPLANDSVPDLSVGFIDGDRFADIVVTPDHLFTGNGTGEMAATPALSFSFDAVDIEDLNDDGIDDLLVVAGDSAVIYVNNGSASFMESSAVPLGLETFDLATVAGGFDFNGDGITDIIASTAQQTGSNDSSAVIVALGDGAGGMAVADTLIMLGTSPNVTVQDIDRDRQADIIGSNSSTANLEVFFNTGFGMFDDSAQVAIGDPEDLYLALATGDLDRDGQPDFVSGSASGDNIVVSVNDLPDRPVVSDEMVTTGYDRVRIKVTNPDGFVISRNLRTVAGSEFYRVDANGNDSLDQRCYDYNLQYGEYIIEIDPLPGVVDGDFAAGIRIDGLAQYTLFKDYNVSRITPGLMQMQSPEASSALTVYYPYEAVPSMDPPVGRHVHSRRPIFRWGQVVDSLPGPYRFQLGVYYEMDSLTYDTAGLAVAEFTTPDYLGIDTVYYWRVSADGGGTWSHVMAVYIAGGCGDQRTGNVDQTGAFPTEVDSSDLGMLVNYLFSPPGTVVLPCVPEADVDAVGGPNPIDSSDLGQLVSYLFSPPGTVVLPGCP